MDLHVSKATLARPVRMVHPEPGDFVSYPCPVCRRVDRSRLIAAIHGGEGTSLESAFCERCEHRYFRKMPGPGWLQRFYAEEWDQGRAAGAEGRGLARRVLRRVPFVQRAWRRALLNRRDHVRVRQVFPLLLGVAEGDPEYYRPRPDVRKVLEVGCGYGRVLHEFQRRGFEAIGTEASEHRARACRELGLRVEVCPIDGFGAVEASAPFDLAYSTHVLEHTVDSARHLQQVASLLREGGFLYLQLPSLAGENFVKQSHTIVHPQTFTPRSLALVLEGAGFRLVRLQADENLQVLAVKSKGPGPVAVAPGASSLGTVTEALRAVEGRSGRRFRMEFDHARVRVTSLDDGATVFQRVLDLQVAEGPAHAMEFRVGPDAEEGFLPVRFHYTDGRPPIWVKCN